MDRIRIILMNIYALCQVGLIALKMLDAITVPWKVVFSPTWLLILIGILTGVLVSLIKTIFFYKENDDE